MPRIADDNALPAAADQVIPALANLAFQVVDPQFAFHTLFRPSDNGALVHGLGREKMVDPSSLLGKKEKVWVMLHVHALTMPDSG
jgi:hypothetical protein